MPPKNAVITWYPASKKKKKPPAVMHHAPVFLN